MGLSRTDLPILIIFHLCFFTYSHQLSQSHPSARALDSLLQTYAYKAFIRPKTGLPYNAKLPSNFTGINITAMRLKCGSLKTRGVNNYNEFIIPTGVSVKPYVQRLALVYQNLGNWSQHYYPLPGYTYLAPVLGLLAYNASELSAAHLPELYIQATGNPILVKFSKAKSVAGAKCVWFDLQGSANMSEVRSGNTCAVTEQGHFSIVVKSAGAAMVRKSSASVGAWAISISVIVGVLVIGGLGFLFKRVHNQRRNNKIQQMERMAHGGQVLHMASLGQVKAPVAMVRRTQPVIETEYVP